MAKQISDQQALIAVAKKNSNNKIIASQIKNLLHNVAATFAQITYVTQVQLAAKHRHENIQKVTIGNVLLCGDQTTQVDVYARKVRKSAAEVLDNDPRAVRDFTADGRYFHHTKTHCIVQHNDYDWKQYLFAIFNNAKSVYVHNGQLVNKEYVAQFCTASGAKEMLEANSYVMNKKHGIMHNVHVRTIALDNIVEIKARKKLLKV
jgi:hypothetical protein